MISTEKTIQPAAASWVAEAGAEGNAKGDIAQLQEQFGYAQELPRTRSLFNMTLMMMTMAAIPYGMGSTFFYPLINGGAPVVFWDWIIMSLVTYCVAVSLGEISSIYPVSGGVYYWSYVLSPPRFASIVAWITGWLSLVGNIMVVLSINFGTAQLILASVNIFDPTFVASPWQSVLCTWALILLLGLIGILGQKWIPHIDTFNVGWIIAGVLATAITLPVLAASGRMSAEDVFIKLNNQGAGWPTGWSFTLGLIQGAYTYSATGMLVSMAEEAKSPELNIPRAMVYGNLLNAVIGLVMILPILFTLGDLPTVLSVATGQPLPEMYLLATGKKAAAFGLFFGVLVNGLACGIACSQSCSRCIWAFARDEGIPFARVFGRVHSKHNLPLNAWLLCAGFQVGLSCIYFGSTAAFNAFVSVAVICLGASYAVPVLVSFLRGRKAVREGPFYKGKLGWICNVVTIVWSAFALVLYSFPTTIPVTTHTMNYASVVFVGFAVISVAWYAAWGRTHFRGPPAIAA